MSQPHALRSILSRSVLLTVVSTVGLASSALADCPAGMGSTARMNCLNTALNAATAAITAQQEKLNMVTAELASAEARVAALEDDTDELFLGQAESDALFNYLSVDTDTNAIVFTGANVFVQNGTGYTEDSMNGLGNLIIGYDEDNGDVKGGSHNIVVGPYNTHFSALDELCAQALEVGGSFRSADYAQIAGVAQRTASLDLRWVKVG